MQYEISNIFLVLKGQDSRGVHFFIRRYCQYHTIHFVRSRAFRIQPWQPNTFKTCFILMPTKPLTKQDLFSFLATSLGLPHQEKQTTKPYSVVRTCNLRTKLLLLVATSMSSCVPSIFFFIWVGTCRRSICFI